MDNRGRLNTALLVIDVIILLVSLVAVILDEHPMSWFTAASNAILSIFIITLLKKKK